jgi:hypothetical protein
MNTFHPSDPVLQVKMDPARCKGSRDVEHPQFAGSRSVAFRYILPIAKLVVHS